MSDQKSGGHDSSAKFSAPKRLLSGWLGYVAIALTIAVAISVTIYVLSQGFNGGILILVWIVVGGFGAIFLARRQAERSSGES
jgi:hypothetical protein